MGRPMMGFAATEPTLRPKSLENHLIREARRHHAVLRGAHSPGEERQSEQEPRRPRRDGGEIVHAMGEEGGAAHRRGQQKSAPQKVRPAWKTSKLPPHDGARGRNPKKCRR